MNIIRSILVILVSSFIAFCLAELSYRLFFGIKMESDPEFNLRTLLFQSGDNFLNIENFFTYHPEKIIRSASLISKQSPEDISDILIEYSAFLITNNAGLLMQKDVSKQDDVILIIGDSFTEGQGATPWFYDLEKVYQGPYKLVNLGILGTGPMQWELLAEHIVSKYQLNVRGIVINIIADDLIRSVWNFNDTQLACLRNTVCDYDFKGGILGFDFKVYDSDDKILKASLRRITNISLSDIREKESVINLETAKRFLKKSEIISLLYTFIKPYFISKVNLTPVNNLLSLERLVDLVSSNRSIIAINTKAYADIPFSEMNGPLGKALSSLESQNIIKVKWCNPGSSGFHIYDLHPNSIGYKKIANCVLESVNQFH